MNVPKLRFKEFTDEWNFIELSKISSDISYGMGLPSKEYDGKNKYIRITDIDDSTNAYSNKDIVSPDGKLEDKYLVNNNDILFARTGASTGKTYLYNEKDGKLYFAGFLIRANIINHNSIFIFQQTKLNKYSKWIKIMSMRSGQPGINSQEYGAYKFSVTSKIEEDKIANFLSLLDKKIELQTKKIEDLKLYKKGLTNKLFRDTTGDIHTLSNIALFENGRGHENIIDEFGNYILINSKFISTNGSIIKRCKKQLTPLYKGNITMVMSDLPNGKALAKCYYVEKDNLFSLNQRICKIEIKDLSNFNSKYIYYRLNRNPYFLKFDDGVNQTNLKKTDILNIQLLIPNIFVQNRDANLLSLIDNKLHIEIMKIDKLIELKKGLMQNMFV